MANSKSNIYPIQLQGAELNLNKFDAEIKQYSGFNKNNSPFVGGCLSNVFKKNETIEGANSENVYIDDNGDIYKALEEGVFKNDEKVLDIDPSKLYDFKEVDVKYNTVSLFDEYAFVYLERDEENDTFKYYFRFYDFNINEWRTEHIIDWQFPSVIRFDCKRIHFNNTYFWIAGYQYQYTASQQLNTKMNFKVFASVIDGEEVKYKAQDGYELTNQNVEVTEGNLLHNIHIIYNSVLDEVYIAEFRSCFRSGQPNFCALLKAVISIDTELEINVSYLRGLRNPSNDSGYFSLVDCSASDFVTDASRSIAYNVTSGKLWNLWYSHASGKIINCEYRLIPDETVGAKVELYNPVFGTMDVPTARQRVKNFNFGVLSASINASKAYGSCDFETCAITRGNDADGTPYLYSGAVLNNIVLLNNETVTGLTLPDTQNILVTDWNSVDEKNIYICERNKGYDYKEDNIVFYKKNDGNFYKIIKTDKIKLKIANNQLVTNCDIIPNSYRVTDGKQLLFAPSWNNRWYGCVQNTIPDLTQNNYFFATSRNEYNLNDNASLLLNPIPIISRPLIEVNQRTIYEKYETLINLYLGTDSQCNYVCSSFDKTFINTYVDDNLKDLPFPINSDGNVQYSPSLFAEVKNLYGNKMFIGDGNYFYPAMIDGDQNSVFSFYLASGVEGLSEVFIIQGQFYGILNKGLYNLQFVNGVVGEMSFIISVENLQFCGNTPYEALFFSKTNRCLYSFIGANVLNQKQLVDKISEVRNYLYNPATQTVFLITDIGVLFYGLFGMFLLEYTAITNIFLLDNGIVMSDNNGNYHYIKYYLDEGDTDYTKENIRLETCFYGMNNEVVTINDCLYIRLFSEEHEEGLLKVKATTISLKGRQTEETTFKIKASDWDEITHTIYLRYQPKEQRGLGISFKIESPFKIAALSVGSQADAILVDKVSKGAINSPQRTSNNTEW